MALNDYRAGDPGMPVTTMGSRCSFLSLTTFAHSLVMSGTNEDHVIQAALWLKRCILSLSVSAA